MQAVTGTIGNIYNLVYGRISDVRGWFSGRSATVVSASRQQRPSVSANTADQQSVLSAIRKRAASLLFGRTETTQPARPDVSPGFRNNLPAYKDDPFAHHYVSYRDKPNPLTVVHTNVRYVQNGLPENKLAEILRTPELIIAGTQLNLTYGSLLKTSNTNAVPYAFKGSRHDCIPLMKEKLVAWLHEEAIMLCRLNHPNIVKCWGYMLNDQNCFIVQDYCYFTVDILSDLRRLGRLSDRLLLAEGLLDGLLYLQHEMNLCHADLKTNNVMVDPRSTGSQMLKIIDFGCACPPNSKRIRVPVTAYNDPTTDAYINEYSEVFSCCGILLRLISNANVYPLWKANESDFLSTHNTEGMTWLYSPEELLDICLNNNEKQTASTLLRKFILPGLELDHRKRPNLIALKKGILQAQERERQQERIQSRYLESPDLPPQSKRARSE